MVTQKSNVGHILKVFFKSTPSTCEDEQEESESCKQIKIVRTAAQLLRNAIPQIGCDLEEYEVHQSLSSKDGVLQFIPMLLQLFLNDIFVGKKKENKVAGIGQAIIQAARPRAILAPLQIGLGIQLHHHYSSAFLIDTLSSFGFCCSYTEVLKFEKSSATVKNEVDEGIPSTGFIQYIADNADHNTRTLDGKNTFHIMGTIAAVTPATLPRKRTTPRRNVSASEIREAGSIEILTYTSTKGSFDLKFNYFQLKFSYSSRILFMPYIKSTLNPFQILKKFCLSVG